MTTELKLRLGMDNNRTRIQESYFTSPLKLATPHSENERLKIVLMMASAGILKGDSFCYDIYCGNWTSVMLTEQSYAKIFDTGEGAACKHQKLQVDENASLFYNQCTVIPFANSAYDGRIDVRLCRSSEFAYVDVFSAGRVGMGEKFQFRYYNNRVCVEIEDEPVWIDNVRLSPVDMDMNGIIFFDGHSHMGTFYYYGHQDKQQQLIQQCLRKKELYKIYVAVSQAKEGICIRVLADTAQDIEEFFAELSRKLNIKV